ncbi:hypothetical protein [Streptomyces sp. KR55]|uniref:hypothetical protein n=1 Tax=Streptomyces sp. KR55 TaxID=3457425 RepID=UPI003FD281E0
MTSRQSSGDDGESGESGDEGEVGAGAGVDGVVPGSVPPLSAGPDVGAVVAGGVAPEAGESVRCCGTNGRDGTTDSVCVVGPVG